MLFESFNFESFLSHEDQELAVEDIKKLINSNRYQKDNPLYQTDYENIFDMPGAHWKKLKYTFLASCFAYLGVEPRILRLNSWGYMTNNQVNEDREKLWHTHSSNGQNTLSGVLYLHIPVDADLTTSGTEFLKSYPSNTEIQTSDATPFSWVIFSGETWHRPTEPTSANYRFVLAADLGF